MDPTRDIRIMRLRARTNRNPLLAHRFFRTTTIDLAMGRGLCKGEVLLWQDRLPMEINVKHDLVWLDPHAEAAILYLVRNRDALERVGETSLLAAADLLIEDLRSLARLLNESCARQGETSVVTPRQILGYDSFHDLLSSLDVSLNETDQRRLTSAWYAVAEKANALTRAEDKVFGLE